MCEKDPSDEYDLKVLVGYRKRENLHAHHLPVVRPSPAPVAEVRVPLRVDQETETSVAHYTLRSEHTKLPTYLSWGFTKGRVFKVLLKTHKLVKLSRMVVGAVKER